MEAQQQSIRHAAIGSEKNDCFDVLQDDILVVILSGLEVRERARTSVLSHRWRNLWKMSGNLDFDTKDIMLRLLHNNSETKAYEAQKYVDLVNRVLETHEGSTVEHFRIVFDMQIYCRVIRSVLDKWVDFAIVKRVQSLELDLNSLYSSICNHSAYAFPSWLLDIPLGLPSFDRLTSLCLRSVSILDADIAYFLSACQLLEKLTLENASWLQNVRVSGQALKLNHLAIRYCCSLESVDISATNLTSFNYANYARKTIDIRFRNVPKLSSLSLEINYCELFISPLHSDLFPSRLEKLELYLKCSKHDRCTDTPRIFPEFSNLRQLELRFTAAEDKSLHFLSSILGASPCLHKLTLKYKMDKVKRAPPIPDGSLVELEGGFTHKCLKVIEFAGWVGNETDVQLANYLIASAVSLEKIIFDLRTPHFLGLSWMGEFHPFEGDIEAASLAATQLERKLPPGAKLIIV